MKVSDTELEEDLRPLGLQKQRRNALKQIAEIILSEYSGNIPSNEKMLLSLPHIGQYSTNAILCFNYGIRKPIVDVNVARVITRFFGIPMPKDIRNEKLWELAEKLLPEKDFINYNYGLLDLGGLICKKSPLCNSCFLDNICLKHINY